MKREDLKALELADDVIDKIMALHGKDMQAVTTTAETAKTELDGVKTQLTEAGTQIENFKKLDIEGVKAAADEWKTKAEKADADAKAQVAQLKFDHALGAALSGAKARNETAVRALLKLDDLKLSEDGKIVGLDDQLKGVKETADYLFEAEGDTEDTGSLPRIVAGANAPASTISAFEAAARKGADLVKK